MQYPESYQRFLDQDAKVFTDTRKPLKDGIFVALSGPNHNGNSYALEALEQGAAYAIVDQFVSQDPRLIRVENTLKELQEMARIHRRRFKTKIIAITGTNGKTTTKELCQSVFSRAYRTQATEGNLNNHIGVPLTLLKIKEDTEFLILEMGANHPGDIHELCAIAEPDSGLITNIGKAHLEGFGSYEGVLRTKLELFDYLKAHGGQRFCSLFSEPLQKYATIEPNAIAFGPQQDACEFSGRLIQSFPEISLEFYNKQESFLIDSHLFGEYNFQNIVAACCLASYYGVPASAIQKGIAAYVPNNMRSQVIKHNSNTIILDAYNANPSSMIQAVQAFEQMDFKNKWIVLGEMAELGSYSDDEHQDLLNQVINKAFQKRIFIGNRYRLDGIKLPDMHFENAASCKAWLDMNWPEDTAILIKGSRAAGLERLLQ
ncbi:MAG: UDP-N-acetylmuramoyl-tripeptide--D-alanyl-D-alanine ligase [Saprospiraceae bacterium]